MRIDKEHLMSLINWAQCRQRALSLATERAHKFNRVSDDVRARLERVVGEEIERIVRSQPSMGKTISVGQQ